LLEKKLLLQATQRLTVNKQYLAIGRNPLLCGLVGVVRAVGYNGGLCVSLSLNRSSKLMVHL
jgi:hypothetical protein